MDFSSPDTQTLTVTRETERETDWETTLRALGYSCVDAAKDIRPVGDNAVEVRLANDTCSDRAIALVKAALHSCNVGAPKDIEAVDPVDVFDDGLPFVFGAHQVI